MAINYTWDVSTVDTYPTLDGNADVVYNVHWKLNAEDDVELNRSFHRHVLDCVSSVQDEDGNWTHTDTDVSGESTEVQGIANAVWTDAIKNLKKAANESAGI